MGLPVVRTGDAALDRFLDAVRIYIDKNPSASGGGRGTDTVRYVRVSDVQAVVNDAVKSSIRNMTRDELDGFAKSIAGTRLFSSLMGSGSALDGVVDGLPRTVLSDIRAAKSAITSAVSSMAIVSAEDNRAVAARLDTVTLQTADWSATVASSGVTVLTMMQTTTTLTIAATTSQYNEFTLVLKQGTGSNKVTWPSNVKHVPIRPATSTQSGWKDFFVLRTFDTGTTWYCFAQGGGVA